MVHERFTLTAMARTLTGVYAGVGERRWPGDRGMTLLVISPDYASHLLPLATLATAWRDAGERVVVASGPATATLTDEFGFDRVDLRLGRGSNPGVIRAQDQVAGEDDALRGFFAATRLGMVPTLQYQADARRNDLLWDPVATARRVLAVVDEVCPDARRRRPPGLQRPAGAAAPGPCRTRTSCSGIPARCRSGPRSTDTRRPGRRRSRRTRRSWPRCTRAAGRCGDAFTAEWNAALAELAPGLRPSADAFADHGEQCCSTIRPRCTSPARTALLPAARVPRLRGAGASRRRRGRGVAGGRPRDPFVYVSFGSFLSVRADVLARVMPSAGAARPVRAAIATGPPTRPCSPSCPTALARPRVPARRSRLLERGRGRGHARR